MSEVIRRFDPAIPNLMLVCRSNVEANALWVHELQEKVISNVYPGFNHSLESLRGVVEWATAPLPGIDAP